MAAAPRGRTRRALCVDVCCERRGCCHL